MACPSPASPSNRCIAPPLSTSRERRRALTLARLRNAILDSATYLTPKAEATSSIGLVDLTVLGIIIGVGALQVLFADRAADFLHDDAFYIDAARSLIQHHFYGIDGHPETNMPPGVSGMLAAMCLIRACSHVAILRAMGLLQTFGFLASYAVLRRIAPRAVAAGICVLLASSPLFFAVATESVVSHPPYFFVTMGAIAVALHLESATDSRPQLASAFLLGILCIASVMMASAGIALAGALVARSALSRRQIGSTRLMLLVSAALLGIAAQAIWMHRKPAPVEWPIPGYPRPYLEQLLVKNGNDPDLGMATPRDVVVRVANNAFNHAALLSALLVHRPIRTDWVLPAVVGLVFLIVLGWISSLIRTGGEVHDWYFAGYEVIYLLWPWALEARFFLPVAPLACLYVWRGMHAIGVFAKRNLSAVGTARLALFTILALGGWYSVHWIGTDPNRSAIQELIISTFWTAATIASVPLLWRWGSSHFALGASYRPVALLARSTVPAARFASGVFLVLSTVVGLRQQIRIGLANVDPNSGVNTPGPDAEAAVWIRAHTPASAVVMARQLPTAYHFAERSIVWFPPSSDPQILMAGIRRLKVDYIIVAHRKYSYYLPSDDDCFARLEAADPQAFQPEIANADFRIFRVLPVALSRLTTGAVPARGIEGQHAATRQVRGSERGISTPMFAAGLRQRPPS